MKTRRVSASFLLVAAMLLSGHAGSSRAFMPQEDQARYEVPLPAIRPQDLAGESSTRACSQVSADLSRRYQGHWSACA